MNAITPYPCRHRHALYLLLLLTASLEAAASSSILSRGRCNITPLICRGGGSSTSLLSTSTLLSRRKKLHVHPSTHTPAIENAVRRKYHKPTVVLANVNVVSDEPSLEELRAQLGPIALLVSNTIELTVVTIGSYLSGALLGYFGGTILSIPSTLFDKSTGGIMAKFSALHAKAWGTCKQWGMLSAAFSGFNNFVRMVRGEREDGWNAVWGSALTGAFLNRSGGSQAMIQGAATYAAFTYFIDKFFASPSSQQRQQQAAELMYTDIPLDD